MIPIPLIVLLSAGGGTILGCAIRQPEINKLKRQVKDLQKDNTRIKQLMRQQQENLEQLMIEYSKLKFYQILDKRKLNQDVRGQICQGYEYKEYVDLLTKVLREGGDENLSEEQKGFLELCTEQIEGKELGKEKEKEINDYIMKKYKKEILCKKDINIIEYVKKVV